MRFSLLWTELPLGTPGRLFRSVMPGGDYDRDGLVLPEAKRQGAEVVVLLASDAECQRRTGRVLSTLYRELGLELLHLPIVDYSVPERDALHRTVDVALERLRAGRNVWVHCSAGCGRTGTIAACLAGRELGLGGEQAIAWVRQHVRGAIDTDEQEAWVLDYLRSAPAS